MIAGGRTWAFLLLCGVCVRAEEAKLHVQLGPARAVTSVAFAPDQHYILTGSEDKSALLWDVETRRVIRSFDHSDAVTSVAFSPDGRSILTGSKDQTARLWNTNTGQEVGRLEGHDGGVMAAAFSSDGRYVVTGGEDGTARVWDAGSKRELRRFASAAKAVRAVAFSPDGRWILTAGDTSVQLWDAATAQMLRAFTGHTGTVTAAAFAPNGRFIVTGSEDKTVRIWDTATAREVRRLDNHSDYVDSVAYSPNGGSVLAGGLGGWVGLWEASTGKELGFKNSEPNVISSSIVTFSPDGRYELVGFGYGASMWEIGTGVELSFYGASTLTRALAFAPDGHHLFTGNSDGTVRNWDFDSGSERVQFDAQTDLESLAVSPDGRRALTGSSSGNADMWDLASGRREHYYEEGPVYASKFSPDGRYGLTATMQETWLWDVATGRRVGPFEGGGSNNAVAFISNGLQLLNEVSGGPPEFLDTMRVWDVATRKEVRRADANVFGVSPDGRYAVWGTRDGDKLVDVSTWRDVCPISDRGLDVFSPDGHTMLTGNTLLEIPACRKLRTLTGQAASVYAAAFAPDGRHLLTAGSDGTMKLWDVNTGQLTASLVEFPGGSWAVVDPAGRYDAADPDHSPGLYFVAGNDVIEINQLKQRFYTPGLLGRIWRGESLPVIPGTLKDVKLTPAVIAQAPAPDSTQATVHLSDRGGGIGNVIVKVNGREVPNAARVAPEAGNSKAADIQIDLAGATLSPTGDNVIEVFAENGDGVIRSRGVAVPWSHGAGKDGEPPALYAIIVGTSSYDDPAMNLRYASKDATDFGQALELAAEGLFGKERTHVSVFASGEAEPTKDNIRRAFEQVAQDARSSDLLVVYFAGHGAAARSERDQYYYFTKEARSTEVDRDPGLRAISTISSGELKEWLSRTNMPLKQVVVLDTCAAGAAFGDMIKLAEKRELSPDQIRAVELLKDSTGSWILMGSAADAVSYEAGRYAQGLLTYALLEGMRGEALDDNRVEVSKLFSFAQREVVELAKGIGGIQQPVLSAPKGQTFPIGLLAPEDRRRIQLATLKPQILRARVLDENDLDAMQLEPALRKALRAASLPVTRGSDRQEPEIVYLDSVVDEVPDALIPQVRYSVEGSKLRVRLRLLRGGQPVSEKNLEIGAGSPEEIGNTLLKAIIQETAGLK